MPLIEKGTSLAEGRYELQRRIGAGGMASVWLADDTRLGREVAIKIPSDQVADDPRFETRFEREAQIAASLSHPNLVPIYDYGVEDGRAYLVMEYIEGESLATRNDGGPQVDPRELALSLLGAVAHMHEAGVIHRDIKPENILVEPGGRIVLTDFGIAQLSDATKLTDTGLVIGTLRYIAPEVMKGNRADARSDLFSCGIVLGDCLGEGAPADLARLSRSLSDPDPARRPRSAAVALRGVAGIDPQEVGRPLAAAGTRAEPDTAEVPAAPELPPPPARTSHGAGRRRLLPVAALLLTVAAVIAGVLISGGGEAGDEGSNEQAERGSQTETPAEEEADSAETAPAEEPAPTKEEPVEEEPVAGAEEGAALNDEGFALLEAGDYAGAVPILEQAVNAFPSEATDGSDINYVYALFNYGRALRLSGDPAAAIPILEQRLQYPNQTGIVRKELEAAQAEALEDGESEEDD